jgi:type I restriction enzyme S subunit
VLNQHIFRAELDEDRVDKKLFVYGVNWRLEELIRRAHGGVGLRHITKSELEAVTLRLPYPDDPAHSLDIQHRIVARIEALL